MFRKIVTTVIVIPLAVIIVAFAVANRQAITISFDPFSLANPAYAATLPLFVVLFAAIILGVIAGGVAAWFGQAKWRRTARRLDTEMRLLHQEMETLRARSALEPNGSIPPRVAASRGAISPPVR
jgi:uncharacterized integral membrane protein